jgi:serine/threonine protein kinase/tetratricopeptide (TPR) repeat protein
MTPEHFRQIDELYNAACERSPEERAALLARADPAVRREVESLLAQPTGGMLLDGPAAAQLSRDSTVTELAAGACLGPYRIESKLGEGGMGEVFRAVDTRLDRAVAIKIAREQFSARFEREGRAISSLNHPNICTLYDVGPNYLVMELVEGETIAACLKKGPLPREMALRYGAQIAAALAEAHGKGIVHRDLKPGNIMIAKSGVKVLDFGLAKSERDDTLTVSRMVVGTPAYMAPEQREGKPADARSDIYSFGCVLYEMLTGRRVNAQRQPLASRALERIVGRCLEQDPARRWQSAAELERELGGATNIAQGWKAIVAAAAVLALFAAGYFYFHRTPKLTDKDTIVLADFENKTSEPVFDGTLRQGLAVQLEQSPFLSLVSDERIQKTLSLMGQSVDARLTPALAKEVCERTASAAVLEGSIAPLGSAYVLGLRAKTCGAGKILDEEQVQAAKKEDVLKALSQIASKFRTRVGESLTTIERHDTPLAEATTPSLDALKAYSTALKHWFSTGDADTVPLLKRAIEIDGQFAMAHAFLGRVYADLWEPVLAAASSRKAYELRNRVSDPERYFIMVPHDLDDTGNLEKAQQTAEMWAETYPRDVLPPAYLSWIDQMLGKYEKSVEDATKAVALDPQFPPGLNNLAWTYIQLNRLPDAENTIRQASELKVPGEYLFMRYTIAFLRGDQAGMQREAAQSEGNAHLGDQIIYKESCILAHSGRLKEARRKSRQAVDLALQAAHKRENAATYDTGAAVREAFFGNAQEARRYAAAALDLSPKGRNVEYGAAFALALLGDIARSQALAKDLDKQFPEDTYVRFTYLPTLKALWALSRGDFSGAIEELHTAAPYELAVSGSGNGAFGSFSAVYLRGKAYLLAHRGAEAAAEFQKILDYPGILEADPVGVVARLQLARAFIMAGDTAKAKTAYQDFLTLWKDADPEIPIFQQAKADYAKLP